MALDSLSASLTEAVSAVAIRLCPSLPESVMERITDTRANSMADSIVYRHALATAAEARGGRVFWYERESVLALPDLKAQVAALGKIAGPRWQAAHKLAASVAIMAAQA